MPLSFYFLFYAIWLRKGVIIVNNLCLKSMPTPSFDHRDKYTDGFHLHGLNTRANILHYWEHKETLRNSCRMTSLCCVSIWLHVPSCVFDSFFVDDILYLIVYSTWTLDYIRPHIRNRQVSHLYSRHYRVVFQAVGRTKMLPVLKWWFELIHR